MRAYLTASVGLWEQSLSEAARDQAAYGALLRGMVLDVEKVCARTAPARMAQQAGPVQQAADWVKYLDCFMGARPDGEARSVKPERSSMSSAG
ncbi:hypothetical protein [Paraburkholderia oxyphila]|uniref:hypothetical protein n=1 Tax=Paraburkholderia oxyphila TaxID=614212 RepID=UPI00047FCD07|nr:hypothetical protein [Paraburkholderia oxyphila]